jgi:opine dehydrogenase
MKVGVLGTGNSGLAMAGHLLSEGHDVLLWNRVFKPLEGFKKGQPLKCSGVIEGDFDVSQVTSNLRSALEVDLLILTMPTQYHRDIAELLQVEVKDLPPILLSPGRCLGRLRFKNILGKDEAVVAEAQTVLHTSRALDPQSIHYFAIKNEVKVCAGSSDAIHKFKNYLPSCLSGSFSFSSSDYELAFENVGMLLHCLPMLLNAGWVDSGTKFSFYREGISLRIANLIEKMDREISDLASKFGVERDGLKAWLSSTYNVPYDSLFNMLNNTPSYQFIEAPNSLEHRYLREDIPNGLVVMEFLAKRKKIITPITSLTIDLATELMDHDFRKEAHDLEGLYENSDY